MFLGVGQQSLLLPLPWATGVLIGYLMWVFILRLLLTLHKQGCIKTSSDEQHMILSNQWETGCWNSYFKMAALATLVLGNVGFLVALVFSIAAL